MATKSKKGKKATALKRNKDGTYIIRTPEEAATAIAKAVTIKESIQDEIDEMERLKWASSSWMKENDVIRLPLPGMKKKATLVQRHSSAWDRDVLLKLVKKAKPKSWKKVWQALTTREPDRDKIQQAIKDGIIKADSISDAFIQKPQNVFVQVFDDD